MTTENDNMMDNYKCIHNSDNIYYYIVDTNILKSIKVLKNIHTIDETLRDNLIKSFVSIPNNSFAHNIQITITQYDTDMYIIDGYHTRSALLRILKENENYNIQFMMKLITVDSYDEIINNYKLAHTTVNRSFDNKYNDTIKSILTYIKETFNRGDKKSHVLSKNGRPRLPNISKQDLIDNLKETQFLLLLDDDDIIALITKFNEYYQQDEIYEGYTFTEEQFGDLNLTGFFLGLDRSMNWILSADNEARKLIIN